MYIHIYIYIYTLLPPRWPWFVPFGSLGIPLGTLGGAHKLRGGHDDAHVFQGGPTESRARPHGVPSTDHGAHGYLSGTCEKIFLAMNT